METQIEKSIAEAATVEQLAEPLSLLLNGGFSVWTDATLLRTRVRVDSIRGLSLTINPKEHAPPHFHVKGEWTDASFRIYDCSVLSGKVDSRDEKLIVWWFGRPQSPLIRVWDETRPADCPVGTIGKCKQPTNAAYG